MTSVESWNYLVQNFSFRKNQSESVIQSDWEKYFADNELFGYSRIKNDVDSHRKLHIGSADREIPDIILRKNGKDLFIVELKQYSLSKTDDFEKQLLNYMAHTDVRLSIGILVCNKIYIYFYDVAENSKEVLEIPFIQNDSTGIKFVELFSKENFDEEKIRNFIKEGNSKKENQILIQEELKNPDLIPTLLKKYFLEQGLEKEFENIWKNFDFKICPKQVKTENEIVIPMPSKVNFTSNHFGLESEITKKQAIQLANENGLQVIPSLCTFSSSNSATFQYWANPNVNMLYGDWWLICNDKFNKILYVFFIPANSIDGMDVVLRTDRGKENLIDLQINYGDNTFRDSRSKISFAKWLEKTIEY